MSARVARDERDQVLMKTIRVLRRASLGLAAGLLCQLGPCGVPGTGLTEAQEQVLVPLTDLVAREVANMLTDSVFFLLDNALVRLAG
jgi:hypothetical protein